MYKKILIANRGEIACRVIRTAHNMGIKTVAVYSEADVRSAHVFEADEAILVGPPDAQSSYLDIKRIVAAAESTGADAIHPGYGFLSENSKFAEVLEAQGIDFIGPPPSAIASMGDKIAAKKVAIDSGVNVIPGSGEAIDNDVEAEAVAKKIGFPVMIKAAAGGGGKGMRIAHTPEDLAEAMASAISEATQAFGDGRVFVEKFIENPRHIEIQVLADKYGNIIHLGERECSIQRRHQKIIEEAPSPLLNKKTRVEMGVQACALAKSVNYTSAGTVEFVADQEQNFYFLEMNTRLQVEHPVTELVTGLDIVEQQIRISAGEKLELVQSNIKQEGWAMECRLYAEDPLRGFMPSIGRLTRYKEPQSSDSIRVDSGVAEGDQISMYYDPMISKLISYGSDRKSAIKAMLGALDLYEIEGISHNISFLSAILSHPRFAQGQLSTAFIEEEYPNGFHACVEDERLDILLSCAAVVRYKLDTRRMLSPNIKMTYEYTVVIGEDKYSLDLSTDSNSFLITLNEKVIVLKSDWTPGQKLFLGIFGDYKFAAKVTHSGPKIFVSWRGSEAAIVVRSKRSAELADLIPARPAKDLSRFLLSPMPGLLMSLAVKEGQEVDSGTTLAVVDAMKMENVLRSERKAVIKRIAVKAGDTLSVDQVIMEFE